MTSQPSVYRYVVLVTDSHEPDRVFSATEPIFCSRAVGRGWGVLIGKAEGGMVNMGGGRSRKVYRQRIEASRKEKGKLMEK